MAEQVLRTPEPQFQRDCHCSGGCPKCQTEQPDREPESLQTKRLQASDTGQIAAPPIVHEVLRSSGQSLERAARDFMEQRFGHDFGRIRIHTEPLAARASAAMGAEAFTVGHHSRFAHERFLPGTAHGKRLVAHELTHAIQQNATSPYIALSPKKKQPSPPAASSKFDGAFLGADRNDKEILVKREVGGTQGYNDRLQAIAVARLARAEPSAVAMGKDGKWHAFETTTGINPADASANDPRVSENDGGCALQGSSHSSLADRHRPIAPESG